MPAKNKKKGWRAAQSETKSKQQIKLALLVLGLIISLLVLSKVILFVRSLFLPITSTQVSKTYQWNARSTLNLLIRTDSSISLLSFNPIEKEIGLIQLPNNLYLEVAGGYGKWQLGSVFNLGQSENPPKGNLLLQRSLSDLSGLPLDGFITFGAKFKTSSQIVDAIKASPRQLIFDYQNIQSNLSPWEFAKLVLSLSGVRGDKVITYNLDNIAQKEELSDGTTVLTVDPVRVDSLSQKLQDEGIVMERLSVGIFNATDHPGLGQKASRIISNLGGNVIFVTQADKKAKSSQVYAQIKSATSQRLAQIFILDCSEGLKCDTISKDDDSIVNSRAQINIILGEDFFTR